MNKINKIKPIARNCPEELMGLADSVRCIADRIENGEVLAFAWVSILVEDKFECNWVKAKGVSKLAVNGAINSLNYDFNKDFLENEADDSHRG